MNGGEKPAGMVPPELPGMLSTLYSYECMFGPYNPQTLALGVQIAPLLDAAGGRPSAKLLLERAAKNLARFSDGLLPVRLRALELLRDHLLEDGESEAAVAVQRELVECRVRACGAADPAIVAEQALLAQLLMTEVGRRHEWRRGTQECVRHKAS